MTPQTVTKIHAKLDIRTCMDPDGNQQLGIVVIDDSDKGKLSNIRMFSKENLQVTPTHFYKQEVTEFLGAVLEKLLSKYI